MRKYILIVGGYNLTNYNRQIIKNILTFHSYFKSVVINIFFELFKGEPIMKKYIRKYIAITIILIAYYGCTTIPQETVMMKDLEGVKMTAAELGIRMSEFGKYFISKTEEASEEIRIQSEDITVKKNALKWRLNVIPAAIQSLSILDPVAAGIDIWALCAQQKHFFTDGNGKNLFGKYQYIAVDASTELMDEMEALANDFRDQKYRSNTSHEILEWTKENPIKDLNFHRRSTLDVLAKTIGSEQYSLGSTVGSIAIGVHDIRKQITLYTDLLPKQIKWQAEYELYNLLGDSLIEKSISKIDRIILSTERISKVIEESPELIKEIQLSTLVEIDKQRLETLSLISLERIAILEAVTTERIAIMDEINRERSETLDKLDEITEKTFNRSTIFASDTIDKLFWRIIILLGVIFIGCFILLTYYKKKS